MKKKKGKNAHIMTVEGFSFAGTAKTVTLPTSVGSTAWTN